MAKWFPNVNVLAKTEKFGSLVVCEDKQLMYEEAPVAYKDISNVIDDLVVHNLVDVVAILRPVLTYKCKGDAHATPQREKGKNCLNTRNAKGKSKRNAKGKGKRKRHTTDSDGLRAKFF